MKKCKKYHYLYAFSKIEVSKPHFFSCFSLNFRIYIFLSYLFLLYLQSKETPNESYALTLQSGRRFCYTYLYI